MVPNEILTPPPVDYKVDNPLPPKPPAAPLPPTIPPAAKYPDPVPVVKVYSLRGVEYGMMTIALWFAASSLAWILVNIVNGSSNFNFLVVPVSILITSVPVFGILFLRLRRAELSNPGLRLEPSKRRWSQLTQFLAFIVCLVNLTFLVYSFLQHFANDGRNSITKAAGSSAIVLVVAGSILAYYWFDEHRNSGA